jgi:hypothetical protein
VRRLVVIGYRLAGDVNGSHAFYGREDLKRCKRCNGLLAKWEESLVGLVLRMRRRCDISTTYDGVLVVSERFRAFCAENVLTGAIFVPLPDDPGFFRLDSKNIVEFDAERAGTRFINRCDVCGQFESVVGTRPFFLKPGSAIPDMGFARTDLEFASGDEKGPEILCGPSAGRMLNEAWRRKVLRGLDLLEV